MAKQFENLKNSTVVFVEGELDQCLASKMKSKIDIVMENSHKKNLIIDLSGVTMMDSSGIGLIIGRYKKLRVFGGAVAVSGAKNGVKKVLDLSGIEKIIPVFKNANEADRELGNKKGGLIIE